MNRWEKPNRFLTDKQYQHKKKIMARRRKITGRIRLLGKLFRGK